MEIMIDRTNSTDQRRRMPAAPAGARGSLTRRDFLARAAALGLAGAAIGGLLAACGVAGGAPTGAPPVGTATPAGAGLPPTPNTPRVTGTPAPVAASPLASPARPSATPAAQHAPK